MEIVLFYIKKLVSFFIMPYGLALTLLMITLYFIFKNRREVSMVTLTASISILLLFSYKYFTNLLLYPIERGKNNYYNISSKDIKYIHVLGSGYSDDTTLPVSSRLSESGLKRIIEGVIEYRKHPNSKLIITGYKYFDSNITYTQTALELLTALGIPKSDIISSGKTKDTDDEAVFAKSIVGSRKYILVTSASHMKRAKEIMRRHGLHPLPVKTDYLGGDFRHKLFFPSPKSMKDSQTAVHEYLGMLWHKLKHYLVKRF